MYIIGIATGHVDSTNQDCYAVDIYLLAALLPTVLYLAFCITFHILICLSTILFLEAYILGIHIMSLIRSGYIIKQYHNACMT